MSKHDDVLRVHAQFVATGSPGLVLSTKNPGSFCELHSTTHRHTNPLAFCEHVDHGQVSAFGVTLPKPAVSFFDGEGLDSADKGVSVKHDEVFA